LKLRGRERRHKIDRREIIVKVWVAGRRRNFGASHTARNHF
jgi:hypothetical protein